MLFQPVKYENKVQCERALRCQVSQAADTVKHFHFLSVYTYAAPHTECRNHVPVSQRLNGVPVGRLRGVVGDDEPGDVDVVGFKELGQPEVVLFTVERCGDVW